MWNISVGTAEIDQIQDVDTENSGWKLAKILTEDWDSGAYFPKQIGVQNHIQQDDSKTVRPSDSLFYPL